MKKINAFTLVELLVIVVILSILAVIAFINFRSYPGEARDTIRKTDLSISKKALLINKIEKGFYPFPDNQITPSSETGWIEGFFGTGVQNDLKSLNSLIKDPLTNNYYKYLLKEGGSGFKIQANLENGEKFFVFSEDNSFQTITPGSQKSITINNNTGEVLIGKQVVFVINTKKLIDSGKLNNECGNIRFYDTASLKELSYWFDPLTCNTNTTKFYVKVPEIGNGDNFVDIKFTDLSDKSISSGEDTFDFYEDFDSGIIDENKWNKTITSYIQDGILYKNSDNYSFASKVSFSPGHEFIFRVKFLGNAGDKNNSVGFKEIDSYNIGSAIEHYSSNSNFNILSCNGSCDYSMRTNTSYLLGSYTPNWLIGNIKIYNDKSVFTLNGLSKEYIKNYVKNSYIYFWSYGQNFGGIDRIFVRKLGNNIPEIFVDIK